MDTHFIDMFKQRGYFYQCTDESVLETIMQKQSIPVYIGFDCTAPTLHVGSLVQIMILRKLQQFGHKPIVLLGGGTTRVGDPSGKDKTRTLQTSDTIAANMAGIKAVLEQFISFGNRKNDALLVNNDDWLSSLHYIDFLRDVGRHFSVNRMLGFDSVKMRLEREQTLSFLEFNYMILQAYDFVELYRQHGCRLQIGGSDQWGNILNGMELGRRLGLKEELFGLTTPLITTASGAKMGKTAQGAVWLTAKDFSAYDYWQFWRNTEDKDVGRFLKLFTELSLQEIQRLEALEGAHINEAKIILANEATTLCHGKQAALQTFETAQQTFEQGALGDDLPTFEVAKQELTTGILTTKLFQIAGLAESGGAAKRLIKGGGAKRNDEKITSIDDITDAQFLNSENVIKLSAGKKKHAVIKAV